MGRWQRFKAWLGGGGSEVGDAALDDPVEPVEPDDPVEPVEPAPAPLVVHRNRELEDQIAEDPLAVEPYLVYADWLQAQGDPRGELIAVQHAEQLATTPAELRDLRARRDELVTRHRGHLLGPV